jgi:hypothetical protein
MYAEVAIHKAFPDGTREQALPFSTNRIMARSKARLISCLTYSEESDLLTDPIVEMRLGDGGAVEGNPLPLTGEEDDLFSPLEEGYDSSSVYRDLETQNLTRKVVYFGLTVGVDDLVGEEVSEAGLFTREGFLFSMKTFPPISKTDEFALVFTWRVMLP